MSAEGYERKGECQHPSVSDADLEANYEAQMRSWGNVDPIMCASCREYLYLGSDVVYAGEPPGAGATVGDPASSRIW